MNKRTRISVAGIVAVGIALAATAMAFAALQQRSGTASVRTASATPNSRPSATGSTAGSRSNGFEGFTVGEVMAFSNNDYVAVNDSNGKPAFELLIYPQTNG